MNVAPSLVFLLLFLAVASVDGLYFHWWKYRLHERVASRREHLLHTVNSLLLVPQVLLMFCVAARGTWLLVSVALALAIYGVELLDVLCEGESRRDLGGLTSVEYALHFSMAGLRAAFVGLYFGGLTLADFRAPAALLPAGGWAAAVGLVVLVLALVASSVHVALLVLGRRGAACRERGAAV